MPVPHREVAGQGRIRHEGRAQSGLLCLRKVLAALAFARSLVYLLLLYGELLDICYFLTLAVADVCRDQAGGVRTKPTFRRNQSRLPMGLTPCVHQTGSSPVVSRAAGGL
jgi:hypothetical protein